MARNAWNLVLGLILAAAVAWLFGSGVRALLRFLGEAPRYSGNVGGLASLVAFLLLAVYVLYRFIAAD
ncbi:hypothetical protein [Halorarius litoreus]|uniref:hypothetical protein n=1 Tax=Halorarius litoreus TaxID=2962676 RepID=UPI0020CC61DC|nr:hypothetical protein [Halorarius litoreus]